MRKKYNAVVRDVRYKLTSPSANIAETAVEIISQEVEKAFERGISTGMVLSSDHNSTTQREADDVSMALDAKITNPSALASIYSKQEGFKL